MPKRLTASQQQPEAAELEKLLTIKDIAEMLQLSTVKIHRLINLGGLPSIKIDGSRRFKPSDVREWLEQHTQAS